MLTTLVTVQSKQSYATAKITATGAKRLQHWLNPLLRHQLRGWFKPQKPMNIFPQMSIVSKQFFLLISSAMWEGRGEQTNSTARRGSSDFTTATMDRCQRRAAAQTHSQGNWYFICTTISYLHSQGTVKTEFQVLFSPARYKDNSTPGAATRPKGAKLARILPLSIQHLTPWQTPQQLCLAALGSVMWLGCW